MKNQKLAKKESVSVAPGSPGIEPRWTSSSKSGIGKSINAASNVTFTLSHGILNEVFFPREDIACIRDMELIVTDGEHFFSEEKRDTTHEIEWMEEGVPAFHMTNTCKQNKFVIEKEIITDPIRDTLLQQITFKPSEKNKSSTFNLYAILNPHLHNKGKDNTGWKGDYKGIPMLFAKRDHICLAFACSVDFLKTSLGFVGTSDGYTDLKIHHQMEWEYETAEKGNITLSAQLDISKNEKIVIAIGFGKTAEEAGHHAWSSILDGFEIAKEKYIYEWQKWQRLLENVKSDRNTIGRNFRTSAAVLRIHESKKFAGGIMASLSIPWGQSKGDDEQGGYHLVWPRDLVLSSGGFLSLNDKDSVLRILNYLMATQEDDGNWSQNMWLEGAPFWKGIQMDQVALPIILVHTACQNKFLDTERRNRYWPIVKKAISYLLKNGPSTPQDRWEEESGYTLFTLSAEIAALLAGADLAEENNEKEIALLCRETADFWNENIEHWTYVTDTETSREVGVDGYYMRINPYDLPANKVKNHYLYLKNHEGDEGKVLLGDLVCVDALSLVRFGLRSADDPRILNTLKVIDAKLKVDTHSGPSWHRYNNDGYGEDEYGDFSTTKGKGRPWPLLTGERAHYEIAAGNIKKAKELLKTMESFANNSLFPEQIWDAKNLPEKGLFFGKHSGSAMPLTWAHAEYIKLCCSIKAKQISDMPAFTQERYIKNKSVSAFNIWRFDNQLKSISPQKKLRIVVLEEAMIQWTDNHWQTRHEICTQNTGLGIHIADIDFKNKNSEEIIFTFFWENTKNWENINFEVCVNKKE